MSDDEVSVDEKSVDEVSRRLKGYPKESKSNLNGHSAPLFSHLTKAFTPVLMILIRSTLEVTMSLTNIDVK